MRKRISALVFTFALLTALLSACSGNETDSSSTTVPPTLSATQSPAATTEPTNPTPEQTQSVTEPVSPETVVFTDSAGRVVEIPANITKISPSGSLAQMFLLAIAPDLLITQASEYPDDFLQYIPAGVADLPVVGQFYGSADLNIESIAAIGPEIVIDIGEPKKTIVEDMDSITEAMAIPAIHITATLESSPDAFRTLGKLLNREAEGEALAAFCEKALAQTSEIMAEVGDNKVSVLYCLGDAGLNVLAAGTFHTEVLDYIADNLAVVDEPSSRGSGNETDMEQLLLWDPEVIIFAPDSVYATVSGDPVWQQLQAIQNGSYYEVPNGPYNWVGSPPSINRYLGMLWLTEILYPDYVGSGFYENVAEYYKLFYHYELSQSKFEELTKNSLTSVG